MNKHSFPSAPDRFAHRKAQFWICGCIASAFLTCEAQGQYDPDWASHLRIGMLAGFNIKTDFKIGSPNIPSKNGIFDDGYVIPNPKARDNSFTSNWGYDDASQFDGDHTLIMHRTTSYTPSSPLGSAGDNAPLVGFDLAYGGNLWYWKHTRIGWDFGFGFLPITATDKRSFQANVNRSIFSFDTGSAFDFPGPGYRGTGGGNSRSITSNNDPGTTDPNPPSNVTVTGSRTLDVSLFSFRLGPSFFWDLNQQIGLSVSAGPALGLVSGNFNFKEMVGDTPSKGSFGASDVLFGGYVNGTITYHVVKNGDFYLSAQYMPLGTSTFNAAGRQARLDLRGAVFLSAGINWPF
jgi:hypothetical protein